MTTTLHIAGARFELADFEDADKVVERLKSDSLRDHAFYLANDGNVRVRVGSDATWAVEEKR